MPAEIAAAYELLFTGTLIALAIGFVALLVKTIIGPSIADRIVTINMIGTMVIVAIAVIACLFDENYVLDICLIYAMLSFLAVIVLTKVYTGVYEENKRKEKEAEEKKK